MTNYIILTVVLATGMWWSCRTGRLTVAGAVAGGITGLLVYAGGGFAGLAMMASFFLMGTLATSWKAKEKEGAGLEEGRGGRTAGQVIANAGVGGLLGICVVAWPPHIVLWRMMMAASFAAATADTLSSELGNIYGSRYYNITTFKKDTRGLNGVISLEGSLLGVAGAAVIAGVYAIGYGLNLHALWIIAGGIVGNIADSLLGATLERKHFLHNNGVNFINTLTGALAAWAAASSFS